MRLRMNFAPVLLFALAAVLVAQDRFTDEHDGILRGFTMSPGEHIMNEYEGVPELRTVSGQIVDESGGKCDGALFELRTEDPDSPVRGVRTNKDGRFRMLAVRPGVYVFKVTLNGFQSVYGKLKVTRTAPERNTLDIELWLGV